MGDLDRQLAAAVAAVAVVAVVPDDCTNGERVDPNRCLRDKLQAVRTQRRHVQQLRQRQTRLQAALGERVNQATRQVHEQALPDFQSVAAVRTKATAMLELAQQWNVVNDAFHIASLGPFATIDGHRLGAQAPTSLLLLSSETNPTATTTTASAGLAEGPRRYLSFASTSLAPNAPNKTAAAASGNNGAPPPTPPPSAAAAAAIRVPWTEINSALGQTALLLSTLERNPHSGIKFRHQIVPLGSTSRIGIRRGDTVTTLYNLYSDDSFAFFGKRNFNLALLYLLECVADAADCIHERDRTIVLPHAIEKSPWGDLTIGGLSVAYGVDGVEWTRAMKYMLTDIKHLLIYRSFGLWSQSSTA